MALAAPTARTSTARADHRRLFRAVGRDAWTGSTSLIQGVLLGGLYALFAIGLSLIVRHHAAGQYRPWRPDRAVGLSWRWWSSTATGLDPLLVVSLVVVPVMFVARLCAAARPAQPARSAADCCRRCWSPSASRSSSRTGCWRCSAPTPAACSTARSRPRACSFRGGIAVGVYPLLVFAVAVAGDRRLAAAVLPHRPRPRLPRHLRRCRHRRADGHRQPPALRAGASASPWSFTALAGVLVRHPHQLRSAAGPIRLI